MADFIGYSTDEFFNATTRHNAFSAIEIPPAPGEATLSQTDIAAGPLRAGANNTVYAGTFYNTSDSFCEFIVYNGGTATGSEVTSLTLWQDDGDSIYDAGDVSKATLTWNAANGYYLFSGSTIAVSNGFFPFVITANVADTGSLTDGNTFKAWINGPDSGVRIETGPNPAPNSSDTNAYIQEINTEIRSAELGAVVIAADTVVRGQTNKLMISVRLPGDGTGGYVLNDVRVSANGTLTPTTDYTVKLWNDDGDGAFSASSDTSYSLTWDVDHWEDAGGDLGIGIDGAGDTLFLTCSFTSSGALHAGVELQLTSGDTVFTTDPFVTNNITSNITSGLVSLCPQVLINEVCPAPLDAPAEFIEIYNPNDVALDLNSWGFFIGEGSTQEYRFPVGASIASKGLYLITLNANAYAGEFPEAPRPNAEWDTTAVGGDSSAIADMIFVGSTIMGLGAGGDEVYIRVTATTGVDEFVYDGYTATNLPEDTWTGTAFGSIGSAQSAGRNRDGTEGAESAGPNTEDLTSGFAVTGTPTPGRYNYYIKIMDLASISDGSAYFNIGIYKTNGDTYTVADGVDTAVTLKASSASCTFSGATVGTITAGSGTNNVTINPASGAIRLLVTDVTNEAVEVGVSVQWGDFLAWYDTATFTFAATSQAVISEVAPSEATPFIELYVTSGGSGRFKDGVRLWDGNNEIGSETLAGLTALVTGDYIVIHDAFGANETSDSGGNAYWDVYTNFNLNSTTEDAAEMRDTDGKIDAVFYGPGNTELSQADITLISPAIEAGKWSVEGDTVKYPDWVHHRGSAGYSVSRDSLGSDTHSKYGWSTTAITMGSAATGFQQYSGVGSATVEPAFVYPGAANLYYVFKYTNNSGITAINGGSFLALEAPSGYPAIHGTSNNNYDSGILVPDGVAANYDTLIIRAGSDTLAYLALTSNLTNGDTIGFIFGDTVTGLNVPAGSDTDAFQLKSDLWGSSVRNCSSAAVYRVYPDTVTLSAYSAASLWGASDTIVVTAAFCGNPVAGAPVTLMITSKTGDGIDGTSLEIGGISYGTYWTDTTVYTGRDGTVTFVMVTDNNDSGANTAMVSVNNGSTTVSETFTDVTTSPTVLFNEIMWNPNDVTQVSDATGEWIELVNTTGDTMDISGWNLIDFGAASADTFAIPASTSIGPYGYVVLAIDPSAAGLAHPNFGYDLTGVTVVDITNASLAFGNSGNSLALYGTSNDTRDNFWYQTSWGGDGDGFSIAKINPSATSDASGNWNATDSPAGTTANAGTPGHANLNALGSSKVAATGASGNGTDTAIITVSLITADQHPVYGHAVYLYAVNGAMTFSSSSGTTDTNGQWTTTATSETAGTFSVYAACIAEDTIAIAEGDTVRFYTTTGFSSVDGSGNLVSSISAVTVVRQAEYATGYGVTDTWALTYAGWSADGDQLAFLEGDFSTVKGNPGSNRRVYVANTDGSGRTAISPLKSNPNPYGAAVVGDIDGDAVEDVVYSGYVTVYASPFWGIWSNLADGSQAGATSIEGYHISPEWTNNSFMTPDFTTTTPGASNLGGGYTLNLSCAENGEPIVFSGKYVKETQYFSRPAGHAYMRRLLQGFAGDAYPAGNLRNPQGLELRTYCWYEPTFSPDGTDLALVRVDVRELADGDADTRCFQSEIWVLRDFQDLIGAAGDTATNPFSDHLVRISEQIITDTDDAGADGNPANYTAGSDSFYMNPRWSRDGKVLSYAVDRSGNFNFQSYAASPNVALTGCNFDVVMKYVGNLTGFPSDGSGRTYDTYPEQIVTGGPANELTMAWSPAGAAKLAGILWDGTNTQLRTFTLSSEAAITASGGILFDNGMVTAVVDAGNLVSSSVIRASTPTSTPTSTDTMVSAGVAREFWPHNWIAADPIQIILHYTESDLIAAGLAEGDPLESSLKVYWYNGASWEDYGGVVDPTANTITFFTTHFSTYAIFREMSPAAAQSSLVRDKSVALADGIDGVLFTTTLRDETGTALPNLPVEFATDRATDTIVYYSRLTGADGKAFAFVQSTTPGTTVVRCNNLNALFTETYPIEFVTPRSSEGLISNPQLPGISLYIPLGAFDTEVGFTLSSGAGAAIDLFNQATDRARREKVAFLPDFNLEDQVVEFHAKRASDGASLDTAFLQPLRLMFDIPPGLGVEQSPVIYLLDQNDEDTDGVTAEWIEYPTRRDEAANRAWTELRHFSIYRMGATSVDVPGLNDVKIYPNPWRSDRHATNANPGMKILLPVSRAFVIKVYTLAGDLVDAEAVNTTGGVNSYGYVWDLNNAAGQPVASGVYFLIIKDSNSGETTVKKVAVIR